MEGNVTCAVARATLTLALVAQNRLRTRANALDLFQIAGTEVDSEYRVPFHNTFIHNIPSKTHGGLTGA